MNDSVTRFNLCIILKASFLPGHCNDNTPDNGLRAVITHQLISAPGPLMVSARIACLSDLNNSLRNYVASLPELLSSEGRVFLRITSGQCTEIGEFNMIYTFENFSWSRPGTIHLSLQIIRHCFSQIWPEPIRNCISLMGQREKISLMPRRACEFEMIRAWPDRLQQSELSSILRHFWHLRKISFSKFEANQFWQTTNVCGKIRKIGVNFGRRLLALWAILQPSLVHNHPELTRLPVSGAVAGAEPGEKWLVEFEIRDHSKPVFLISFLLQKKAKDGGWIYLPGVTWWLQNN